MARLRDPRVIGAVLVAVALMVASAIYLRVPLPHIQLPPETLWVVGGFPITNTMVSLLIADVLLIGLAFAATRRLEMVPGGLQNFFEAIVEFWENTAVQLVGEKLTARWLPFALTLFLLIWFSNAIELVPGFDSVGILCEPGHCPGEEPGAEHEGARHTLFNVDWTGGEPGEGLGIVRSRVAEAAEGEGAEGGEHPAGYAMIPYLRVTSSDLNFTLALAILAFLVIEIAGFQALGLGYLRKFFNFDFSHGIGQGLLNVFVGLLELVSELSRVISFAFRLFGNLFAGQTLLFVLPFLVPLFIVLPIYGLELFVGLIQGFVFAILTLAFMSQAVVSHHGDEHH